MDRRTVVVGLRQLLLAIYDEQYSDWSSDTLKGRKPNEKARQLYEFQMWPTIDREGLEKWLSEFEQATSLEAEEKHSGRDSEDSLPVLSIDFSERYKFLYLPPLEKNAEFVPILSLKCVLDEETTSVRIKVMLLRLSEPDQKPFGIGFRLENPECDHQVDCGERIGRHDFYHAQLLKNFSYGPQITSFDWIPEHQPSFPLLAEDPVTLLFSLLLTLYGEKYCFEFYNKHSKKLPDLSEYLKKLKLQPNR